MKMKAYTVCARAQASFFYGPLAIQSKKKHRQIVEEVWTMTEKVVKSKDLSLEDKLRSGWPFFHKMCEKYFRKKL